MDVPDADPDAIRRLATTMRAQGEEVRDLARGLARQLDGARWTGRAAEAARAQVGRRVADLLDAATRHDRAGDALARHAAEVERCRSLLRRAAEVLS
jgi:hypothetical protein